jgi:hypothetical protein
LLHPTAAVLNKMEARSEKVLQRRSHSHVQQKVSSSPKLITEGINQKRLSAVLSKYIGKPLAISKQTWQIDSSSWEFLNQAGNESDNTETGSSDINKPAHHISSTSSDKSKPVDSGLDSTMSFTAKSEDKDSVYESELGTLDTSPDKSQLVQCRARIKDYIVNQLATEEKWVFGKMICQFLECTNRLNQPIYTTLRNVRQFMTGMKNYLIRQGEGDLHSIISEERAKVSTIL